MSDCIFCKIAAGQIGAKIVFQNQHVLAFRDVNPQAPVHILLIPRKHVERLSVLTEEDMPLVAEIHLAIQAVAKQEKLMDGFRVVANDGAQAGQSVWHLHYHLLGGRPMGWPPG